jgi:hypothetical protein
MFSAKDELRHFVECLSEEEADVCLEACRRALGENSEEEDKGGERQQT